MEVESEGTAVEITWDRRHAISRGYLATDWDPEGSAPLQLAEIDSYGQSLGSLAICADEIIDIETLHFSRDGTDHPRGSSEDVANSMDELLWKLAENSTPVQVASTRYGSRIWERGMLSRVMLDTAESRWSYRCRERRLGDDFEIKLDLIAVRWGGPPILSLDLSAAASTGAEMFSGDRGPWEISWDRGHEICLVQPEVLSGREAVFQLFDDFGRFDGWFVVSTGEIISAVRRTDLKVFSQQGVEPPPADIRLALEWALDRRRLVAFYEFESGSSAVLVAAIHGRRDHGFEVILINPPNTDSPASGEIVVIDPDDVLALEIDSPYLRSLEKRNDS